MADTARKPSWLKVKTPLGEAYSEIRKLIGNLHLHTVCQEANCPNRFECWSHRTATFMILGDRCTRSCKFCDVRHGEPKPIDPDEPMHVAEAANVMGLEYVVVTSVTRDDLSDGGAAAFAETIRTVKRMNAGVQVEVLVPDFGGDTESLAIVLEAGPDVLNHNIETTQRLTPLIRSGADYGRSLALLQRAARHDGIRTKSGLMVGLGESMDDLRQTFDDLSRVSCELLTLGQYLAPSDSHYPVARYCTPEEFDELREIALEYGFKSVLAGPLVRSSYHAHEQAASDDLT